MQAFGPVNPKAMATCPAEAFGMSIGTMKGLTRSAPLSRKTLCWLSRLPKPPMPVENMTPVRAWSTDGSPASRHASLAAASAKWTARSVRFASLGVIHGSVSKSWISPAIRTEKPAVSKLRIGPTPDRPAVSASQNGPTPTPTGVTGPMPVITMRRRAIELGGDPELGGHELDGLPDGLDALHLLFGDRHPELLLEGQHGLGQVEGVCVQVLLEPRLGIHL